MDLIGKEYLVLFNAISDANEQLTILKQKLIFAQQQAEEIYINKDTKLPSDQNIQGNLST